MSCILVYAGITVPDPNSTNDDQEFWQRFGIGPGPVWKILIPFSIEYPRIGLKQGPVCLILFLDCTDMNCYTSVMNGLDTLCISVSALLVEPDIRLPKFGGINFCSWFVQ